MNIIRLPGFYLLLLFSFINCSISLSQVVVERSKEKVVISGVPYYLHTVRKGETAYSISRAYGITVGELIEENPSAGDGLKEGENLRIQVSRVAAPLPVQAQPYHHTVRDESRFLYHILKQGETVYSLSKAYNVTETEITQSNPGIDISKIPVGSEIAVPRKYNIVTRQEEPAEEPRPNYHKVVRGETMSTIASRYGITVRELRRMNNGIRFPQVGDYLIVPGFEEEQVRKEVAAERSDTIPDVAEMPLFLERPESYTPVNNLRGSLEIAVLLPFYLSENARRYETDSLRLAGGKQTVRVQSRPRDWIYPGSLGFLEMYEGILLAADTLRSLGLNINISAFDIKSDTMGISRLVSSGRLDRMDLIIGPVHSSNLAIVARFAGNKNIPVVSPVPLADNSVLKDNPVLFMAGSSLDVAQRAIAGKINDYYDHNILVIHSDTTGGARDLRKLREYIMTELAGKIPLNEIKYKELMFYSRSVHGLDSVRRLANSLSDKAGNVIIVASEDPPLMSETLMDIHSLLRRFDIKVLGYPHMRNLENLDPKYFFELNLMLYSPYWIDFKEEDVKQFNFDFRSTFYSQPSETSFAWEGYDIAYYFISGLAIHGKEFIMHPEIHRPDLLQTEFDFRRESYNDGFENRKLFLIRYTSDYEVIRINERDKAIRLQN